jgi:tetratricopeptide (TPR) repeat protein
LFTVLLAASVVPSVAYSQPRANELGEDFPLEDYSVWLFVERGLKNQAADLQLARAPESPETIALLLNAYRTGDALTVLRRIVDHHPEQMGAAFKAATTTGSSFDDEGRGYPSVLRETVTRARQRLRELPREQAAEAAWYLHLVARPVPGETPVPWRDQIRAFVDEYAGTEAALLGELRLLDGGGDIHASIAAIEAFARRHPGTVIGAQALWTAAMHLGFNAREPRGADPTERLLRIAALARELQSGAYPDCEWVRQAPGLVFGFFAFEPQYARENLPRVIAVFREFLVNNFDAGAVNPLASGAGYLTTNKLPAIFVAGGGEPVAQIDRLLLDLEQAVKEPAAVTYVRGLWYRQLGEAANDLQERNEWRRKADATLLDLGRTGEGLYNRKALASLASIKFRDKDCSVAVERYREYVSRFPQSEWAWVAGLRVGQCEQFVGDWVAARRAYESVAPAGRAAPLQLVLAQTFAGRASEALGDPQRARTAYERAERAWDPRFADAYFGTYQFYTRLDEEPCNGCDPRSKADVSREWLRRRSAQLKRSLSLPGGVLLERGRFFVTEGMWRNAVAPLDGFIRRYPDSPSGAEARELLARAKLEIALLQVRPDAGEEGTRAAIESLDSLAEEPYSFSVFAAHVARATLHSILGSTPQATALMSAALAKWHDHGVALFAKRPATKLQEDVMDIRDAVFNPKASPTRFFIVTPDVRVKLHDDSAVRVEAASRLCAGPGALLLDEEQIAVLQRILMGLGGTTRLPPQGAMRMPNQPSGGVEQIQKFWNRFFTMGPGHWGGWIFETFPIVSEVTFIDAARTRGAARIRIGYEGSTQLLTKADRRWKVTGSSGHWIE